jgi:hypothetical protein
MKIRLEGTEKQLQVIRNLGSRDEQVSQAAARSMAGFISNVAQEYIRQASLAQLVYEDLPYSDEEYPTIPLDLWHDEGEDQIEVWSQTMAGGLPSSEVRGFQEIPVMTYNLSSAANCQKSYLRRGLQGLMVTAKMIERMTQIILTKEEKNAWAVVTKALAEARTNGADHIITSGTESVFTLSDISSLITLGQRVNDSFAGGTPENGSTGPTHIFVSPEILGQIRGFVYNPMNSVGNQSTGPVALPEQLRTGIYSAAGAVDLFGIKVVTMNELGTARKYNTLFDGFAGSDTIAHGGTTFTGADDEIVIGYDANRGGGYRPILTETGGGTLSVRPDNQYFEREDKIGYYAMRDEGRVWVDARSLFGIVV